MFGNSLRELLASPRVDLQDKARAFKCFKRMDTSGRVSEFPLCKGDLVTVSGLQRNRSLNGETGTLGEFENGRWQVPSLGARVLPVNLIKAEWKLDRHFTTSVLYEGTTYLVRIEPDQTVRVITPNGIGGKMLIATFPWDDMWMEGFNKDDPASSDLFACSILTERAQSFFAADGESMNGGTDVGQDE